MSSAATSELLPEFTGFFESARAGRVAFPRCRRCGRHHRYPMPRCPHCRGHDIEWRDVAGPGEIVSFTRVMHPFDKSRAGELPYVVALVKFADAPGISLVTNIVDCHDDMLRIGQSVTPVFRTSEIGRPFVEFRTV
jgi:uncharacterized OB-fold protein